MELTDYKLGIQYITYICFGNHPKSKKLRDICAKLINKLYNSSRKEMSKDEIQEALKLDLNVPKDRTKFYRIIMPLRGKNALNLAFISSYQLSGQTFYHLSLQGFNATKNNLSSSIEYVLKEKRR